MKRLFLFAMVLCGTMTTTAQDKQLFDDNWQFTRNGKTTNVRQGSHRHRRWLV